MSAEVQDVQIDPRGYRFGAAVTLVIALVSLVRLLALALVLLGPFLVSFHRVLRCSDH